MQNSQTNQENVLINEWELIKMNEGNYYKNVDGALVLLSFDHRKINCVNIGKHSILSQYILAENEQVIDVLSRLEIFMAIVKAGVQMPDNSELVK